MAPEARKKKASWVSWRKTISFRQNSRKSRAVTWRISSGRTVSKRRRLYLPYVTNCAFCGLNVDTARQAVRPSALRFLLQPAIAAGTAALIASVIAAFTWRPAAFADGTRLRLRPLGARPFFATPPGATHLVLYLRQGRHRRHQGLGRCRRYWRLIDCRIFICFCRYADCPNQLENED